MTGADAGADAFEAFVMSNVNCSVFSLILSLSKVKSNVVAL